MFFTNMVNFPTKSGRQPNIERLRFKIPILIQLFIPFYGSSVRFRVCLRLREIFRKHNMSFLAVCLKTYLLKHYGCELSVNAEISPKCIFMHTTGIIIGEGVVISPGVKFYGRNTLGRKDVFKENDYPIICENVVLGTGACVLGQVKISPDTVIAANAVVLSDTEACSLYGGIPAKRLK